MSPIRTKEGGLSPIDREEFERKELEGIYDLRQRLIERAQKRQDSDGTGIVLKETEIGNRRFVKVRYAGKDNETFVYRNLTLAEAEIKLGGKVCSLGLMAVLPDGEVLPFKPTGEHAGRIKLVYSPRGVNYRLFEESILKGNEPGSNGGYLSTESEIINRNGTFSIEYGEKFEGRHGEGVYFFLQNIRDGLIRQYLEGQNQ